MPCHRLPPRLLALTTLLLASVANGCSSAADDAASPQSSASSTDTPPGSNPKSNPAPAPSPAGGDDAGTPEAPLPEGDLAKGYVDFAINHVLSTGQSNSVANGGTPVLTSAQPYTNVSFDTGVMSMSSCNGDGCFNFDAPSSFVPLVEGDTFFDYGVETASSGIANEISHLAAERYHFGTKEGVPAKHDVLVSLHGRSGNTYWCLRKGSCNYHAEGMVKPFSQAMMEVQAAKQIADSAGLSYAVRAVTTVHGESDHYAYTGNREEFPLDGTDGTPGKIQNYADALIEWQHDYETDAKAITGQTVGIPMLVSQLSGWNDVRTSRVAQWQLDAHVRAPGKVVLVAPGYAFSVREDCLHYDNNGQRRPRRVLREGVREDRVLGSSLGAAPPHVGHARGQRHHREVPGSEAAARPRHHAGDGPRQLRLRRRRRRGHAPERLERCPRRRGHGHHHAGDSSRRRDAPSLRAEPASRLVHRPGHQLRRRSARQPARLRR